MTSTQYASEQKICELAQGWNKLVRKTDGEEYMISPFAPLNLPPLNDPKRDNIIVPTNMANSNAETENPAEIEDQR